MKEALRYSAALLGELRTSLLRWVRGCGVHGVAVALQLRMRAWMPCVLVSLNLLRASMFD